MSTDRDIERIVRSWMDEGVTALPDRVLDAVLGQLPATPQRRSSWLARRFPSVNTVLRLGIVAAVVALAVIFGSTYINNVGSYRPTPIPNQSATLAPLPTAGSLQPGIYFMDNPCDGCADYQRIIVTLPAGWATSDGLVYKHLGQPDEVGFSVWTVDKVYADPCHWQGSALTALDLRDHTHSASGAIVFLGNRDGGLANQLGRNASALTQVTLGGEIALKIELSVPAQLDLATCDRREFRSWAEIGGGANSHAAPGQLDTVYMVDVDRGPLVIDASHMPAASAEDLAELEAVLASMIVDRGQGSDPPSNPNGN